MVEADLHSVYGIDMEDRELLARRSWRWLKVRLVGLCNTDCRFSRAIAPDPPKTPHRR